MKKQELRKRSAWKAQNVLEKIDVFSEPIPNFNIRGKTKLTSWPGGFMTICVATIVLMYATVRFEHMISKINPNINDYLVDLEVGQDANLNEYNFRIAFSVEDFFAPH